MARATTAGDVTHPGPPAPWAPRQTYFPKWLFGEWEVESTFTGFRAPLGPRYVDPSLLQAAQAPADLGGIGSSYSFSQRYFSTLPDTLANQVGRRR
jgi:hypothetical protein